MIIEEKKLLTDFWVIGISYHKSDTFLRGVYAINEDQYEKILNDAPAMGVSEIFVLSTCNRTEIYGFAKDASQLTHLLCKHTEGHESDFTQNAYCKNEWEAIRHLFDVSAGLDSQILGDYEIVGQLKQAFNTAKDKERISWFMDRLFKTSLQSSRDIRSKTKLSSGSVSVAFAAVKFVQYHVTDINNAKILVIGSGSIGKTTCLNLLQVFAPNQITISNRTYESAQQLAESLAVSVIPYESLNDDVHHYDVVILATGAKEHLLYPEHLMPNRKYVLVDLAVPQNIDPAVAQYKDVMLANVDDLSKINDETLRKRSAEIPKVKELIDFHIHDFSEWYHMRQNVPIIKAVKEKLNELNVLLSQTNLCKDGADIQKALNDMASKLRSNTDFRPGCRYIETIHNYISDAAV